MANTFKRPSFRRRKLIFAALLILPLLAVATQIVPFELRLSAFSSWTTGPSPAGMIGALVEVVVTGPDGLPIQDAKVTIDDESGISHVKTDSGGTATANLEGSVLSVYVNGHCVIHRPLKDVFGVAPHASKDKRTVIIKVRMRNNS